MAQAYVYDSIRTPRGKGKDTGSLHQIAPVKLAETTGAVPVRLIYSIIEE